MVNTVLERGIEKTHVACKLIRDPNKFYTAILQAFQGFCLIDNCIPFIEILKAYNKGFKQNN